MLWYKLVDIKLNKTKQLFDEIDLLEQELETDVNLFKNLLNEDLNNNKLKLLIQKICIKKCIQNSEISISYICQNKNYDYILKLSKKIEILKLRNLKVKKIIYDEKYLKEYKDIKFNNKEDFESILTTFLPKGYSGKEINYLFKLSEKNINILKEMDYKDISNYYVIKNFNASNIDRYIKYEKNSSDYKDIVTKVNLKLDLPVYTDTEEVKDADDLLVLVNKYNHLPKNYKPSDLTYLDGAYGNKVPMRSIIKEPFLELQAAAKKEINIKLMPTTAFRDESFQRTLYTNYVNKEGVEKADTYSARPSYSEHQTGLSIDLKNIALSNVRLTDENYEWLHNNAYKYGFIIRFPKDKENITLYQFENWHIRYVGKEAAKIIYENNLTLEEYIDLYITEY